MPFFHTDHTVMSDTAFGFTEAHESGLSVSSKASELDHFNFQLRRPVDQRLDAFQDIELLKTANTHPLIHLERISMTSTQDEFIR